MSMKKLCKHRTAVNVEMASSSSYYRFTNEYYGKINALADKKISARKIEIKYGWSERRVQVLVLVKEDKETGTIVTIRDERTGRTRATTEREDRTIVRPELESPEKRRKTSQEIVEEQSLTVSDCTIRQCFQEEGLYAKIELQKLLVSSRNLRKRLAWVINHIDWPIEEW